MQLERITLSNFRCFGADPVSIDFRQDVTAIVGNNGSGKTALFAALAKLFGTTAAQRALRKSDFHVPFDAGELPSGTAMYIDCIFAFPELDRDGADDDAVPEVFNHMSAAGEDEPLKIRMRLQATWTADTTPDGAIDEEVRWILALNDDYEWDECKKVQAVERNFIQLVYVPASRNAFDQVTSLLKGRLWRAAQWSPALRQVTETGSATIQGQFDNEAPAQFIASRLETRWQQVHQADTDTKPLLKLIENNLDELATGEIGRGLNACWPISVPGPLMW